MWLSPLVVVSLCFLVAYFLKFSVANVQSGYEHSEMDKITTAFPRSNGAADPALIFTTWDWYLLSHLSANLIRYDHELNVFVPELASSWQLSGNIVTFKLKSNLKFHDGTLITSKDIAATFKRLIVKRTSTHFPIWKYIHNCNSITDVSSECDGIKTPDDMTLIFRLTSQSESLFLLLASPEGGVWHYSDLVAENFTPKRFSGAYFLESYANKIGVLKLNPHSHINNEFPDAPKVIEYYTHSDQELQDLIKSGRIDVYMEIAKPYYSSQYEEWGLDRHLSAFTAIYYLAKVGNSKKKINRQFLQSLWEDVSSDEYSPAETFLPFGSLGVLSKEEFLENLELVSLEKQDKVKIASLKGHFHTKLLDRIRKSAEASKIKIEIEELEFKEWSANFATDANKSYPYDFVLAPYVASERYPSVQVRYILDGREPPFETKTLDMPKNNIDRIEELKKLESWMVRSQVAIPLYFVKNHVIHKKDVDIGYQPVTDSEIELWRVKRK